MKTSTKKPRRAAFRPLTGDTTDPELERIRLDHRRELLKLKHEEIQRAHDRKIQQDDLDIQHQRAMLDEHNAERRRQEGPQPPPLRVDDHGRLIAVCEHCDRRRAALERIGALAAGDEPRKNDQIVALVAEALGL